MIDKSILVSVILACGSTGGAAAERVTEQATGRQVVHEKLVAETHNASLKLRQEALRRTIAKDTCWPPGIWGDNLWTLSAPYLNEKVDAANVRLLKQAKDYIEMTRKGGTTPANFAGPGATTRILSRKKHPAIREALECQR